MKNNSEYMLLNMHKKSHQIWWLFRCLYMSIISQYLLFRQMQDL